MAEPLDNQMDTLGLFDKEKKEDETLNQPFSLGPRAVDLSLIHI